MCSALKNESRQIRPNYGMTQTQPRVGDRAHTHGTGVIKGNEVKFPRSAIYIALRDYEHLRSSFPNNFLQELESRIEGCKKEKQTILQNFSCLAADKLIRKDIRVTTEVKSFVSLFENAIYPLAIDNYQRGFVWNDQKINQLHEDLVDFHRQRTSDTPDYYMGTILLHTDIENKKLFVIDGQQ